nr:plasmid replication initiator TrfA [Cupriavidus sp. AcVe19-1a]
MGAGDQCDKDSAGSPRVLPDLRHCSCPFQSVKERWQGLSAKSIAERTRLEALVLDIGRSRAEARASRSTAQQATPRHASKSVLPSWPENMVAIPNVFARLSLFNVRNINEPRQYLVGAPLRCTDRSVRATYTGLELRQIDFSNYLQILYLMRGKGLGELVEFSAHKVIQEGRRITSSKQNPTYRRRLMDSLYRLRLGTLTLSAERLGGKVTLPLLSALETHDRSTGEELSTWKVAVDPKMALLFGKKSNTWLEWERHRRLPAGLASWLHGYFASHAENLPVTLARIQRASGAGTKDPARFAQLVRQALQVLENEKFLVSGEVEGGVIRVRRVPGFLKSTYEVSGCADETADFGRN